MAGIGPVAALPVCTRYGRNAPIAVVPPTVWICAVGLAFTSSSPADLVHAVREAWCSGASGYMNWPASERKQGHHAALHIGHKPDSGISY